MSVTVVGMPPSQGNQAHYPAQRSPLLPSPLLKLPLGAVRPAGWLRHQLDLMADGMTGRLAEVSAFLQKHGWFGDNDEEGWEEQGYWFRGFHDLAVLTGRQDLLEQARRWIDGIIDSQQDDGYFGATMHKLRVGENGVSLPDLWPHMVMLDAIIHHYEYTGDERVVPFMTRFFDFCRRIPDDRFVVSLGEGYGDWKPWIQNCRAGDMIPHLHWLYNETGEDWLLDLATRFFDRITGPANEWLDEHIVNFTQRFSYTGLYYPQSRDPRHLALVDYWYNQHLITWGQQPRGIFGADEIIQKGCVDPRHAFETCGMVEFNKSFYLLGRITGDARYADRVEDVTLNHFPAAQTPDLKGLKYLTASNMPQLDPHEEHAFKNLGQMLVYSPWQHRCCQHNVAMGWPWYAQHGWQATLDGGLAAWLYGAGEVEARVGQGEQVRIEQATDYPFATSTALTVRCDAATAFPLYLRVPGWSKGVQLTINGEAQPVASEASGYLRIERSWKDGDQVRLAFAQETSLTSWPRTGAVTVDRGPLSYSVKIEERWEQVGEHGDPWPEHAVWPASPWNHALVLQGDNPAAAMQVIEKGLGDSQPWTPDAAPIEIKATARRVPDWTIDDKNTVGVLPQSPVETDGPDETITLIPLGCARLRMACLPVAK